jgi:SAM-dependent methyltransferase
MARSRPSRPSRKQPTAPATPIRPEYDRLGPAAYYAEHGAKYANPHEAVIRRLMHRWIDAKAPAADARILDLCCGSGEISAVFIEHGIGRITGIDPYTGPAYRARTGFEALPHDFVAISQGVLDSESYDFIFCSFALHLADTGLLPQVCLSLARISPALVVLTPHKRPEIRPAWGWQLDEEVKEDRVRLRHYSRS